MWLKLLKYWYYFVIAILIIALYAQCGDGDPKVTTKTKTTTKERKKIEPIINSSISKPEIVYRNYPPTVTFIENPKIQKDTVYIDNEKIPVLKYPVSLRSNNAQFNGFAYVEGNLYDFEGSISYLEKTTTKRIETTINRSRSGFFAYGQANTALNQFGVGVAWQIRNKIIIGAGLLQDIEHQKTSITLKLGVRLF